MNVILVMVNGQRSGMLFFTIVTSNRLFDLHCLSDMNGMITPLPPNCACPRSLTRHKAHRFMLPAGETYG